jgi:hypothetical protein
LLLVVVAGSTGFRFGSLGSIHSDLLLAQSGVPRTPTFSFCGAGLHLSFVRNFIPVMHSSSYCYLFDRCADHGTPAVPRIILRCQPALVSFVLLCRLWHSCGSTFRSFISFFVAMSRPSAVSRDSFRTYPIFGGTLSLSINRIIAPVSTGLLSLLTPSLVEAKHCLCRL